MNLFFLMCALYQKPWDCINNAVSICSDPSDPLLILSVPPSKRFLPDQNPEPVAKLEEAFALRIMRAADEIAAERLEILQVAPLCGRARGAAFERRGFVAIDAFEENRL